MRPASVAPALLPVLVMAACGVAGAGDADLVERVDSAGVEHVRNLAPERPLPWRFERTLTLGGVDEGPQAFGALSAELVGTDDAGRIYVADATAHVIHVFDAEGTHIRAMGGRGGGPGEFQFVAAFAVAGDGTARLADFSKGGIVAFGPDGETLPEIPLDGFPGSRLRSVGDGFANVLTRQADAESDTRRELLVVEPGDTTSIAVQVDELEPGFTQLPDCPIGLRIPPLLAPSLQWDARGGRIAVTDDAEYAIDVWERDEASGWRQVRRVMRALPLIPSTVEIAAAEYPDSFRIRGGNARCAIGPIEIAETLGYADVAPHVQALALAPGGTLWIRHRTADDDVTRIDVFDPDGTYIGTLPAGSPFPAAFRGPDEIVSVEKDELDRPLVVVSRIVRP